ncbi:MAG: hypothetical protein ACLFM0_11100 [Spirochaetales bacterium]
MESASLYAFWRATANEVVCIAHVTNEMAVNEEDFDKGEASGAIAALEIASSVATRFDRLGGARQTNPEQYRVTHLSKKAFQGSQRLQYSNIPIYIGVLEY